MPGPPASACRPQESVLSGLTVEQLGAGHDAGAAIRGELERAGAPRRPVEPKAAGLMLADTADAAFSRAGWIFEPKLDGYRVLAARGASGGPPPDPERQRLQRRVPRSDPRHRGAAVRVVSCWTARWSRWTTRASRAFSGCRADRGCAARSISGTRPWRRRSPTTPSTSWASRTSISGDCRSPAGRRCCSRCFRRWARSAIWSTSTRTARRCTARPSGWVSRGSWRRRPRRPTRPAARPSGSRCDRARPATTPWWATPRPRAPGAASAPCTWPNS